VTFATTEDGPPATAPTGDFVLVLTCPDQPGVVHAVSGFLVRRGGNIVESQQFGDQLTGRFFMRLDFVVPVTPAGRSGAGRISVDELRRDFAPVASQFDIEFELWEARAPYRTLIMVSKHLHCLNDLLFRYSTGSLQIDIPAVVSNHLDAEPLARAHGLDFAHIPVTPETKPRAEDQVRELVERHGIHLVVLARYMQVLPPDFCAAWPDRIINIHHSFLPAFQGARPYHQAHERGVKLVGVTAHYATATLDDGPIIDQDVIRVSHRDDVDDLRRKGRDLEVTVLARALRAHVSHRVLVYGRRTVVFD
jgi:formyltetrahydrofolate deformylase